MSSFKFRSSAANAAPLNAASSRCARPIAICALWLLSACSMMDMQGQDPKDFYAANPIQNKVASAQAEATITMTGETLSNDQLVSLKSQLHDARPAALETLTVESLHTLNAQKRAGLMRSFSKLGYRAPVIFNEGVDLAPNEVRVSASYATIVAPDCPDWKTSPVTTYSNTKQGNFGCATTTNLGLMLEDPRDLERGAGSDGGVGPHSERAADAVTNYRHGMTPPAPQAPVAAPSAPAGGAAPGGALPMPGI